MRYILVLLGYILPLLSQTVSLSIDNDYVFDSDNGYTGGAQIGWMSDAYETSVSNSYVSFMDKMVSALIPLDKTGKYVNGSANLQEVIVTPDNTDASEPVYNDVPYIGILTANFSYYLWDTEAYEEYRVSIGTVGSYSGAEELQNFTHDVIGDSRANGWKNQLGDYVLIQAGYQKGVRQYETRFSENNSFEWFNSYFLDVGNIYTGIGAGSTVRYGHNVPRNFTKSGSLINGSQNDQLNLDAYPYELGWSLRAGLFADAVGYFHLVEKAKDLGYDVDTKRLIVRGELGMDIYQKNYRLSFDLFPVCMRDDHIKSDSYGRITITWYLK